MDARLHIGQYIFDWQPSNKPFGLCFLDNNVIINVDITLERLKRTLVFMSYLVSTTRRTSLLFVNSVPEPEDEGAFINQSTYLLKRLGYGYVLRWLPGYLSNLPSLIIEYWRNLPKLLYKKRKSRIQKALLKANYSGLRTLARFPDLVCFFSSAGPYEIGVKEVLKLEMPTILFGDTDVHPKNSAGWIPSNDDHITTMYYQVELFREALLRALKKTLFKEVSQLSNEIRSKPGLLGQFYEIKTVTDRGLGVGMAQATTAIISEKRDTAKNKLLSNPKKTSRRSPKLAAVMLVVGRLAAALCGGKLQTVTKKWLDRNRKPSWELQWDGEEIKPTYKKQSQIRFKPSLKKSTKGSISRGRNGVGAVLHGAERKKTNPSLRYPLQQMGRQGRKYGKVSLSVVTKRIINRRKARALLLNKTKKEAMPHADRGVVFFNIKKKKSQSLPYRHQRRVRWQPRQFFTNQLRKTLLLRIKPTNRRVKKLLEVAETLRLAVRQYIMSTKSNRSVSFYRLWGIVKKRYKFRGFYRTEDYGYWKLGGQLKNTSTVISDLKYLKTLRRRLRKISYQLIRTGTILRYCSRTSKSVKIAVKLMGGYIPSNLALVVQLLLSGNDLKGFLRQQLIKALAKAASVRGIEQRTVVGLSREARLGLTSNQVKIQRHYCSVTGRLYASKEQFKLLRNRSVVFRYGVSLGLVRLLFYAGNSIKLINLRRKLFTKMADVRVTVNRPIVSKKKKRVIDHYKHDTSIVQTVGELMAWKLMAAKRDLYWRGYRRWIRRVVLRRWRLGFALQLTTARNRTTISRKTKTSQAGVAKFIKISRKLFGGGNARSLSLQKVYKKKVKKKTATLVRLTKKDLALTNKRSKGVTSGSVVKLSFLASRKKAKRWLVKRSMAWIRGRLKLLRKIVRKNKRGTHAVSYLRSVVRGLGHQLAWFVKRTAGTSSEVWLKGLLVQGRALWALAYLNAHYLKKNSYKPTAAANYQSKTEVPAGVVHGQAFLQPKRKRRSRRSGRRVRERKLLQQLKHWSGQEPHQARFPNRRGGFHVDQRRGTASISLRDLWLGVQNSFRFKVKLGSIAVHLWRLRRCWQRLGNRSSAPCRFFLINATSKLLGRGVVKKKWGGKYDKIKLKMPGWLVKKHRRRRGYVRSKGLFRFSHYDFIVDRSVDSDEALLVDLDGRLAKLREHVEVFGHGDWARANNRAPRLVVRFRRFGKNSPPQVRERYNLSKIGELVRSLSIVHRRGQNKERFVWLAGVRQLLLRPKKRSALLNTDATLSKVQVGFAVHYGTRSPKKGSTRGPVLGAVRVVMRRLSWRRSIETQSNLRWHKQNSVSSSRVARWRKALYTQQCTEDRLLQRYNSLLKVLSFKISKARLRLRVWVKKLGIVAKNSKKQTVRKGARSKIFSRSMVFRRRMVGWQTVALKRILACSRKVRKLVAEYQQLLSLRAARRNLIFTRVFILVKVREKVGEPAEENDTVSDSSAALKEADSAVSSRRCWLFRPWRTEQLTDSEVCDSFWRCTSPLWVTSPLRKLVISRIANSKNQPVVISRGLERAKRKPQVGYRQLGAALIYSWRFGVFNRGYIPRVGHVGRLLDDNREGRFFGEFESEEFQEDARYA